jgi:hypothetical protein
MKKTRVRRKSVPVIDTRLRSNQILWRYLDLAKFLDFIMYGRLYFARGDQFTDKFEGAFTKSLRQKIRDSYEEKEFGFTYSGFKKRLRERVYLNCWHRGPDDNMAMWRIYGGSNPSVAITTTVGKLTQALKHAALPHFMSIRRVTYIKHWQDPKIDITPYSNIFAYKVRAYNYEKEVRAIIDRHEEDFDSDEMELSMYVNVSPSQLLRSVVFSPEAPVWFKKMIRKLIRDYELDVSIKRSRLDTRPI